MKEEITVRQSLLNTNKTNNEVADEEAAAWPASMDTTPSSSSSSITPMLLLSVSITVLGSFSFGFVIGYTSPVQAEITKELDLSTAEFSLFGSMVDIGAALGAVLCGKITDSLGRRNALKLTDLFYILGWCAISVGKAVWLLDLGRWMLGFALGITGYAVPIFLAEFAPGNLRGGFVVVHVLMITAGSSAAFLVGLVTSWRTLALVGIIPSIMQAVGLFFIPESPRWLMMMSKDKEFEAALQCLRGRSVNVSQEADNIRVSAEMLHQMEKVSILQLFQKKYAYSLTVGIGLSTLVSLLGLGGITFYAKSILESVGYSGSAGTIQMALFQLPSVGLAIVLIDKCGRRPLLMVSATGLCLGCLLTALAFLFEEHHLLTDFSPYIALIGILIFVVSYPFGMGSAASIVVSEIYPLNIKGSAGSIAAVLSHVGSWMVAYFFNFSMEWSSSGTFFVLAGINAFTLIFVAKLVPETRGRTLEEVHLSISNVWQ